MRILFQHGQDPYIGDKPLAPLELLMEEPERGGAFYGGQLFDTAYNRDLVPALRAGQFGSSFRFQVTREQMINCPGKSDYNPEGLPERTIGEVRLLEIGPVTFAAYPGTTAGVSGGQQAPRSARQPSPSLGRSEFLRRLTTPPKETAADRQRRQRWADSVRPLPGRR